MRSEQQDEANPGETHGERMRRFSDEYQRAVVGHPVIKFVIFSNGNPHSVGRIDHENTEPGETIVRCRQVGEQLVLTSR